MQEIREARRRGKTLVSNQAVLQCIIDLHTANPSRLATRHSIAEELGVGYRLVDEHVDKLLAKGLIYRVVAGVFAPVHIRSNRAVSGTALPSGEFKVEVGDQVLDVNPWEANLVMRQLRSWLDHHLPSPKQVQRRTKDGKFVSEY